MTVSLVKITPATTVYVVGYSYGPYSPDPDHVHAYATISAARSALADVFGGETDSDEYREVVDALLSR